MNNILEISDRLKQYRINYPMTQRELADKTGISVRSISRFENGEDISLSEFLKILRALELDNRIDVLVPDYKKGHLLIWSLSKNSRDFKREILLIFAHKEMS